MKMKRFTLVLVALLSAWTIIQAQRATEQYSQKIVASHQVAQQQLASEF